MQFQSKVSLQLPFKLDLSGMSERDQYLRADWFWAKEPETIEWIDRFEPNSVFWDVGANIGVFSLYAMSLNRNMWVWAFEPALQNFIRLKRNIELNGWWNVIKTEQIAFSNETGMANFQQKRAEIGSSGGQIGKIAEFIPQNENPVEVTTIDAYADLYGCPHYLKIDVDGIEHKILLGAEKTLKNKMLKSLLIEDNYKGNVLDKYILSHGFKHWEEIERIKLRSDDNNSVYVRL